MQRFGIVLLISSLLLAAQVKKPVPSANGIEVPLGLLPIAWPRNNPYTPAKEELGRFLYFDPRLSADDTMSCATCHNPKFAFGDGEPNSIGIHGQRGTRSAPTIFNRAYSLAQFWDGRAGTLEDQAKGPMANPIEMGSTLDAVVQRVKAIPGYQPLFEKAFGPGEITIEHAARAIATFERTILSGNSPYDRYSAGNRKAMTAAAIRGKSVFFDKAKCDKCHDGMNFTTNDFHNLGVGMDKPNPDLGRFLVTKDSKDWGAFKTPTLREIASTAPYMHDGSLKTLEEVIELYDKGGIANPNLDREMKPLKLTPQQKHDLVEFLRALSGDGWQKIAPPVQLPQ